MSEIRRVVYDCNTFLQALGTPNGPAGRCVRLALEGKVALFISATVLDEIRAVAARPKVAGKLRLTPARVERFIDAVSTASTLLDGFAEPFQYERDPDDAHYVNLAIAAGARLVVSRDRDLLDLMNVGDVIGDGLRARFPDLRILTPPQFLVIIDAEEADEHPSPPNQ